MSKHYKIWMYIEEIDEDTDNYEDVVGPISYGQYTTQEAAEEILEDILNQSVMPG